MGYVVKFFDLRERTKEEFEYVHLFDALSVAKNAEVGPDRLHIPVMTHDDFDSQLLILLTSGVVYGGLKSEEYPEGDIMVMLLRRDGNGTETVVFNALPMPAFNVSSQGDVTFKAPLPKRVHPMRVVPLQSKG